MHNDHLVSSIYKLVPDTEGINLLFNLNYPREASHNADVLQCKYTSVWFHLVQMKRFVYLYFSIMQSHDVFLKVEGAT